LDRGCRRSPPQANSNRWISVKFAPLVTRVARSVILGDWEVSHSAAAGGFGDSMSIVDCMRALAALVGREDGGVASRSCLVFEPLPMMR
jgi:hypothetical protein